MSQPINTQAFAFAKQFADSAFRAQTLALKGLERVAELHIAALEKQTQSTSDFITDVLETRDLDGLRHLWEKGATLSKENAERVVAVAQEVIAVTQKTAESLGAIAQQQQQAANDAVAAPVAAVKKAAAAK